MGDLLCNMALNYCNIVCDFMHIMFCVNVVNIILTASGPNPNGSSDMIILTMVIMTVHKYIYAYVHINYNNIVIMIYYILFETE